ncbi:DUF1444 family protein [Dokdonia sp. Asnod3-C12]|uniref:DUF1444 family protein n=1 Tax=Dokdonia sp. Asnod3-C12 TaxID=3160575 RepID=UPI00387087CC
MDKLIPILKTSDYRKDDKLFFKEYLFESKISPVIAYGTDSGRMVTYESASDENDLNLKFPKIKEEAISNLKLIDVSYQITDAEGTKILFAEGNEYASEKILDKDFMIKIAEELNCGGLMVGIPFKGLLIAIDSNSPMRLKLPVIVKQYFDNPQQDRISDKVFLVQNGEVVAIGGEDLPQNDNLNNFVISENKKQNYSVELNSKNIEELTKDVNTSFQQVLAMIMQRKLFGGEITYKLSSSIVLNQALKDKCNSYVQQIEKNELLQSISKALAASEVKLKFFYNDKQIAPELKEKISSNEKDFTNVSNDYLDKEFNRILGIPNARTNIDALTTMSVLRKEYEKRGIKMPNERKSNKWWEFWK